VAIEDALLLQRWAAAHDAEAFRELYSRTITLPRTCDLAAILLDPSGPPRRECRITGEARYGDVKKESFSGRTDREGRLKVEGLPALPMTLWIEVEDKTAAWESGPIVGSPGKPIDLDKVVLGPSRAGDG
jgi:hypothetical protein